ncbi:restriction endonuclease subunit R [Chryseobacterium indologenes]|uniref:helicase-related protein n=1 Tax=Chryseobacterium indologenes TaxID=253 RepID=UPI000F4FBEE6|nr:helicase-related protein [Chryseobacterium indologenes]AYZ35031.1 restriction endonuclease subunit R [Chryseobacterium indologenes]MBF6643778.1 DEAD/DEAH box helicase family protein [Chryseobacterium indologenes]MEB4762885.1 helicase-related protein [Chryseobacterium indologenes]QQQ72490.1 DEAD/DEAH box helicase family protein [Chryseobacterium indologenes]
MSTKFFTNEGDNSLIKKFEGVFKNQNIAYFDALVGYFRSSGYFKVRKFLDNVPQIRILVGIDVDVLTQNAKLKGQLYLEDRDKTQEEYINFLKKDIAKAEYNEDVENGIIQFIEDIISKKVLIRAHGVKKLHAKVYIFRPEPFNEHSHGSVITGSSNLTDSGLGTHDNSNYEFNVLLRDYEDVKFATDEFEKLWDEATEVLPTNINKLKKETYLNQQITPYEVYMKMLIEYFGDAVIRDKMSGRDLPADYTNLQYQSDAVAEGFAKLIKHNGFILADVVGLGKTVVATRIIKRYIDKNGFNTKILVVYPNALEINWKTTIKDFGIKAHVDFVSNGSLHKIINADNVNFSNPEEYDLIVIDESHKFRSDTSNMYGLLEIICKTPRARVGNDTDRNKKVMLISATPLNNRPEDIANQLYLFQNSRKSTIESVPNLQSFFASKIEAYKSLYKIKDHSELIRKVKEIYEPIRENIFRELVIRRTRADIENIKRYKEDIKKQNLKFPKIVGPNKIEYVFDDRLNELFLETVMQLTTGLHYYRYRAIEYLNSEHQELYENAKRISDLLSAIMKTQLVKRLESSFYAFKQTLNRFRISNGRMIEMFENDKVFIAPDIDINKYFEEGRLDDLEQKIEELNEKSPNNSIFKANDFDEKFLYYLKEDQKILDNLCSAWEEINYDPKLKKFISEIKKQLKADYNCEKKLVVFSESKETVNYLADELQKNGITDVLAISSLNHKQRYQTIRKNFDANYNDTQENEYNIIITTEVLAEGINLHRSNVLINYDIPWNSTRLMQRIGRVNRIGTKADKIYIHNFFPTAQSNSQIKLNEKAIRKLQGFHSAFGEDSKVYSETEELIQTTLGNLEPMEDIDERLQYLENIRELYNKNYKEYQRLKSLPMKSRVGRLATIKEIEAIEIMGNNIENSILCYLRNNIKEAFYVVNEKHCLEITFLQAVKLFDATKKEQPEELLPLQFDAIQKAIKHFRKIFSISYSQEEYDTQHLAVQERNSITFIKNLLDAKKNAPEAIDEDFEELILTAKKLIYMGVFRKFRLDIAAVARKQKKKRIPIEKLKPEIMKIFDKYPIRQIARLEALRWEQEQNSGKIFEDPKIVLSETFS